MFDPSNIEIYNKIRLYAQGYSIIKANPTFTYGGLTALKTPTRTVNSKESKMNYSTAVFLINDQVRAIACTYETPDTAKREVFKTLDSTIQKGDYVIVPTNTRHNMTIVKVVEPDVEPNFDQSEPMEWIIGKVDRTDYEKTVALESTAITKIRNAELRTKREALRESLFKDNAEKFRALPLASSEDVV